MAQISREDFFNMQNSLTEQKHMPPTPDFVHLRSEPQREESAPPPTPTDSKMRAHNNSGGGASLLKMLNFKAIKMDSDRTVILALMLLLMGDTDDELLLLALLYIML